jgi:hypothetical protein
VERDLTGRAVLRPGQQQLGDPVQRPPGRRQRWGHLAILV